MLSYIISIIKGHILFANVYMPADYGDSDSLENYINICSKLCVLFTETEAVYMVIAGDFNCEYSARSRFFTTFMQFITRGEWGTVEQGVQ